MQPTESTQQVQPVQTQPVARQMIAPSQAPESADTASTTSTTSKSSWFPFRLRGGAGPCCEMLGCCLCCCALEDICCCGLEELC